VRPNRPALGNRLFAISCSVLNEGIDDKVDELPDLRRHVVSRRIIDVERKPFVRPIGKQIDLSAAPEVILETKVDDLRDAETGRSCA